jgi:electron transfer flavoprotein beta subunit
MQMFVLMKMVPDTVEELTVAPDGKVLDADCLRFKLGDSDEHALEQALLLKERHGGTVTVLALDAPEVEDALYTALAKGADRAVKLSGDFANQPSLGTSQVFAAHLNSTNASLPADALVLLRSQAIDDLDGEIGPFLSNLLGLPYVAVVTSIAAADGGLVVTKELGGGLRGEFAVPLPAVVGIQSAEKPPRYVPIAKVRATMKTGRIETVDATAPANAPPRAVERLHPPPATGRATMLEGSTEHVAEQLVEVLARNNLI